MRRSALFPLLGTSIRTLQAWVMRKFKRFRLHKTRASRFLAKAGTGNASLFVHWQIGMTGTFA